MGKQLLWRHNAGAGRNENSVLNATQTQRAVNTANSLTPLWRTAGDA